MRRSFSNILDSSTKPRGLEKSARPDGTEQKIAPVTTSTSLAPYCRNLLTNDVPLLVARQHGGPTSNLSIVVSLLAGLGGGWAFYVLWRKVLPRPRSRVFWQAVPVHASGMVHSADPDDVSRHYGALMKHVATFATRNTLAVIAGLLPVVALFLMSNVLYDHDRRTPIVEVRPATAVLDITASVPVVRNRDGGLLIDRRKIPAQELRLLGETLDGDALTRKSALCYGWLACLGYELMLFETHQLQSPPLKRNARTVVVRPRVFAANLFWPFLDDLELAFLAGVIAGSIATGWRSSLARKVSS